MKNFLINAIKMGIFIILSVALTACGLTRANDGSAPAISEDDDELRIESAIAEISGGTSPRPLAELTEFEWDEVALFEEGEHIGEIESLVGDTGLSGKRYLLSTNLLVFRRNGAVVNLVRTSSDVFDGEYRALLGPNTIIEPLDPATELVVLSDPDA